MNDNSNYEDVTYAATAEAGVSSENEESGPALLTNDKAVQVSSTGRTFARTPVAVSTKCVGVELSELLYAGRLHRNKSSFISITMPDHAYYLSDANDMFLPQPGSKPPIVRPPKPINQPYFHAFTSPSHRARYLAQRYQYAVNRYHIFENTNVIDGRNVVPEPMQCDVLYRYHMKDVHIHGFFRIVRKRYCKSSEVDMYTRYLQDTYYGHLFPLYLDFDQWPAEEKMRFKSTSNYLIRFFEAILTHIKHEEGAPDLNNNSTAGTHSETGNQASQCTAACRSVVRHWEYLAEQNRQPLTNVEHDHSYVVYNPPPLKPKPIVHRSTSTSDLCVTTPQFAPPVSYGVGQVLPHPDPAPALQSAPRYRTILPKPQGVPVQGAYVPVSSVIPPQAANIQGMQPPLPQQVDTMPPYDEPTLQQEQLYQYDPFGWKGDVQASEPEQQLSAAIGLFESSCDNIGNTFYSDTPHTPLLSDELEDTSAEWFFPSLRQL